MPNSPKRHSSLTTAKVLLILYGAFVFFGTGLPIDLQITHQFFLHKLHGIQWIPFGGYLSSSELIGDFLQNTLLFLPLGFLGFFSRLNHHVPLLRGCLVVALVSAILSASVESIQLLTRERVTSVTDLLNNVVGGLAGFWSGFFVRKQIVTRLIRLQINTLMLSRTAYPCLLCLLYVIADRLQPFRFSLEPQLLKLKLSDLWNTPFVSSLSFHSEGLAIVPFFLFSGLTAQLMLESGLRNVRWALLISLGIGSFLETSQLIVASRMMGFQDLLIIACSCWCGVWLFPKMVRSWSSGCWALLIIAATVVTASIDHLSPFQFTGSFKGFNWVPFIAYYEKSSFVALRNFLHELLVFLPLGFALRNALRNRYAAYGVILSISLALAAALEYAQGWTAEGVLDMPDITDILGALGGACAGALLHTPGWKRYEAWVQSALAANATSPREGALRPLGEK